MLITGKTSELLSKVTKEVKEYFEDVDVVTPDEYQEQFEKIAVQHGCRKCNKNLDEYEFSEKIVKMGEVAAGQANRLEQNTESAIQAMRSHNEVELKRIVEETEEMKRELTNLRDILYIDELTKAFNRKWFTDNILDGQVFLKEGIFAIIDLNDFKKINDECGHLAGDKALIYIAKSLNRSSGQVIRYGGDEFMVIFDEAVSEFVARTALNQIRNSMKGVSFKTEGNQFRLNFAFGVKEFSPSTKFEEVLEAADKEMYMDKTRSKAEFKLVDVPKKR